MTIHPYTMKDLDEVRGQLHHVEETDGGCLALIGKIPVLLPAEVGTKLKNLVGRRVGILRLDGYRLRAL